MVYEVKLADRTKFLLAGINRTALEQPLAMLEKGEQLSADQVKAFLQLLSEAVRLECAKVRDTRVESSEH